MRFRRSLNNVVVVSVYFFRRKYTIQKEKEGKQSTGRPSSNPTYMRTI